MKKILLLLSVPLLALAAGCQREYSVDRPGEPCDGVTLSVRVNVPTAQTREAIGEETIDGQLGLWLMVFSQNGTYLSRYKGILTGGNGNYSDYTFSGIPVSNDGEGNPRARILHFVANYDFDGFNDTENIGAPESSIIPRMTVENGRIAYWQRVILENGFNVPNTSIPLPEGTVHLLRNIAQITVVNRTQNKPLSLTDVEFVVGNYFDKGSIAPYNTTEGVFGTGFGDTFVMEAPDGTPVNTITEDDLVPESTLRQIYERENSTATAPAYVIVKGFFDGSPQPSYYKIDIVSNEDRQLIDLQRNRRYTVYIDEVSNDGNDNLRDAINGAASNNINASTVSKAYPSISDGVNVLEVEGTTFTYMESGAEFEIWYSYTTYDQFGNGTVDNVLDDVVLDQTPGRLVVADGSLTAQNGVIRGRTATVPASGVNEAEITISKGILSRSIRLLLRPVMDFEIVRTYPANRIVPTTIGSPVSITFKMPDNISESLFPLPIRIYTRKLTPTAASGLSIEYGNGDYWYVYNAPYRLDGDDKQAEHTIEFVSNSTRTEEVVTLAADRFNDANVRFGNYSFMDVSMTTPLKVANTPVDVSLTIPADYWKENDECEVTFNTTNLVPLAGNPSGLEGNNPYRLTVQKPITRAAGDVRLTVHFQTDNSATSTPSAIISAPGFNSVEISAPRPYEFRNARFTTTNGTTARKPREVNNTDLRVNFQLADNSGVSAQNPVTVTFVVEGGTLTLRTGNSNNITNLTQNGNRITMNVTNMNAAYFTVRTGNRNTNVMTLEAPGYITTNDLNAP